MQDNQKAVGGDVKFTELMGCLEAWTASESKIDAFREMWKDQETADGVIEYLKESPIMFMNFVNSSPSDKHSHGRNQLCKQWVVEKYRGGAEIKRIKMDLTMLL